MIIIVWHCWGSTTSNDNDSLIFLKKSGAQIDSPTLSSQKIFLIFKIVSVIISFIIIIITIITIVITDNRDHIKRWQKILFANVANQ